MDASIKSLHKNFMEWIAGPTGSVVIHVVLILALLFLVDLSSRESDPEIEVMVMEVDDQTLDELLEDLQPPEELPDLAETITPPDVDMDMTPPPDVMDFAASPVMDSVTELDIAADALSPLIMKNLAPGTMANRSGEGRKASLAAYGGRWAEYAEAAVLRALAWLKANQNPDGSWGTSSPDKEGYTGLAILTFLAHGETTASPDYGQTVERAIRYLVARQNEAGEFASAESAGAVYAHAIASYAISEAYGMTRILSLKTVMERAINVMMEGQQRHGGWNMYTFKKGSAGRGSFDVSLSAFVCQAFKAAYVAGASNPGLREAMDKAAEFLIKVQWEDGRFPYSPARHGGRQPNMTAAAVLSLQLMGYGNHEAARSGLRFIRDADASWSRPEQAPLYSWYYVSQAMFHQGGNAWTSWNNKFAPALIRNQNPDGSWLSPGLALEGDGVAREFRGEEINSKVYATTFAALSLQVYYRFLPTYQPVADRETDQKSSGDVQIQIL